MHDEQGCLRSLQRQVEVSVVLLLFRSLSSCTHQEIFLLRHSVHDNANLFFLALSCTESSPSPASEAAADTVNDAAAPLLLDPEVLVLARFLLVAVVVAAGGTAEAAAAPLPFAVVAIGGGRPNDAVRGE